MRKLLAKLGELELDERVWLLLLGCTAGIIFWVAGNLIISISDWRYALYQKSEVLIAPEDTLAPAPIQGYTHEILATR